MTRILIVFFFIAFNIQCISQPKSKIYKLKIYTKTGRVKSGYLRAISDSSIVISAQPLLNSPTQSISLKSLHLIKSRDRAALFKGPAAGALSGAFFGALVGLATYQEPDCSGFGFCLDFGPGLNAMAGAVIGGASGALLGLAFASSSKKIQIGSGPDSYELITNQLTKYIIHPDK